jgi:hypothetical protein
MQTVGYWCDECRTKYVQHKCKDGLPCGHDRKDAIKVYVKAYGKSHQRVTLSWHKPSERKAGIAERETTRLVITYKPRPGTMYAVRHSRDLWAYEITLEDGTKVRVGDWLKGQPEKIRRAFLERWSSSKEPPIWRQLSL